MAAPAAPHPRCVGLALRVPVGLRGSCRAALGPRFAALRRRRRRGRRARRPLARGVDPVRRRRRAPRPDAVSARMDRPQALRERTRDPADRRYPAVRRRRLVRHHDASTALRSLRRRRRSAVSQPPGGPALGHACLRLAGACRRRLPLVARAARAASWNCAICCGSTTSAGSCSSGSFHSTRRIRHAGPGGRARDAVLRRGPGAVRRPAADPRGPWVHHAGRDRACARRSARRGWTSSPGSQRSTGAPTPCSTPRRTTRRRLPGGGSAGAGRTSHSWRRARPPRKTSNARCSSNVLAVENDLVIVPAQDLLGLGNEARMNRPGTVSAQNWSWRLERPLTAAQAEWLGRADSRGRPRLARAQRSRASAALFGRALDRLTTASPRRTRPRTVRSPSDARRRAHPAHPTRGPCRSPPTRSTVGRQ